MTHQTFQSRLQGTQSAIQEEANDSDEESIMQEGRQGEQKKFRSSQLEEEEKAAFKPNFDAGLDMSELSEMGDFGAPEEKDNGFKMDFNQLEGTLGITMSELPEDVKTMSKASVT